MAYWIIVAGKDRNDPSIDGLAKWQKRKDDCFWGVPQKARRQREIVTNDYAFFYIAAPQKILLGPIKVLSAIHQLTDGEKNNLWSSESLAFTANQGFFFKLDEELCGVCSVPDLIKQNKLNFVKDKNNWGLYFHDALVKIDRKDFQTILKVMADKPLDAPYLFEPMSTVSRRSVRSN